MIDKAKGKYYGVCDICSEITEDFKYWDECKDWLRENWRMYWNENTCEWQHFCSECRGLK